MTICKISGLKETSKDCVSEPLSLHFVTSRSVTSPSNLQEISYHDLAATPMSSDALLFVQINFHQQNLCFQHSRISLSSSGSLSTYHLDHLLNRNICGVVTSCSFLNGQGTSIQLLQLLRFIKKRSMAIKQHQ